MSTYVLVHGACHGAWCWNKIVQLLKKYEHTVETLDLPGHGQDKTPIANITLRDCADRVCEVLDRKNESVILVGHSMGGHVISQVAEERPKSIKYLVYLSAMLLQNGQDYTEAWFDESNSESLASQNMLFANDMSFYTFKDEAIREIFYNDCSDEDIDYAKSQLVPAPMGPITTPVRLSEERYGSVPRIYIECLQDKCIAPAFQKKMYTAMPCRGLISMDTGHSPFFSAQDTLADHLLTLA